VEEALCFGWIDSKPNKRNEESYFLFFAPRKPKSVWSAQNKKRIEKLLAEGRMTPMGMQKMEQAKDNGSWAALNLVDALVMPAPLKKAFSLNKAALRNFEKFPPSAKKGIYQWMQSAKTETTMNKRVAETVALAAENKRPLSCWPGDQLGISDPHENTPTKMQGYYSLTTLCENPVRDIGPCSFTLTGGFGVCRSIVAF
jgi:uncharacterized protein YdeI (YjbR/CyaY-like superfamily)